MKRIICGLTALCMLLALTACGGSKKEQEADAAQDITETVVTGGEGIDVIGEDGIDWNHMSMDELYEMAKKEGGTITIYATTADADTARKHMRDVYPDLKYEYISCDTNTVMPKIEMEAQSGTPMADVLMVKDASGEVFNEYVLWDLIKIYYPADVCEHIKDDMLRFGLPLYSTFNPWFYIKPFGKSPKICNFAFATTKNSKSMGKGTNFSGQPVLSQLIKLMDRSKINILASKSGANYYTKHLDGYSHLVVMLYAVLSNLCCGNGLMKPVTSLSVV